MGNGDQKAVDACESGVADLPTACITHSLGTAFVAVLTPGSFLVIETQASADHEAHESTICISDGYVII